MSTTQPRFQSDGRPAQPHDPDDVFPALVERNPDVCRRCYTRLRERQSYPWLAGDSHGEITSYVDSVPDGDLSAYVEQTRINGRTEHAYPPCKQTASGTTACRCGAVETHRTPDTRSKAEAIAASYGITSTLTEYDIPHDWLYLVKRVAQLKSKPDFAGDDFRTFKVATAESVRVARTGSPR